MAGRKIHVGPWPEGLNRRDAAQPHLLKSSELAYLKNLYVMPDGVLRQRMGLQAVGAASPIYNSATQIDILGSARNNSSNNMHAFIGVTTPTNYKVYQSNDGYNWSELVYTSGAWSNATQRFTDLLYYAGEYYFLAHKNSTGPMYKTTAIAGGTWTSIATAPKGDQFFIWRDRMFVIDYTSNRVLYSKATDPTIWTSPDGGYFDVGDKIVSATLAGDGLYLFGLNTTWLYTFTADPTGDGYLRVLSSEHGGISSVLFNDRVVVVNFKGIWQIVNGNYLPLDSKYLIYKNINPSNVQGGLGIVVLNNQLLVGPITGFVDITHAMFTMDNKSWTDIAWGDPSLSPMCKKWARTENANQSTVVMMSNATTVVNMVSKPYFAGYEHLYATDVKKDGTVISPEYAFKTGYLDFGDRGAWKRLYYLSALGTQELQPDDAVPVFRLAVDGAYNVTDIEVPIILEDNVEKVSKFPSIRYQALGIGYYKAKTVFPTGKGYGGNSPTHIEVWSLTLNTVLKDPKILK